MAEIQVHLSALECTEMHFRFKRKGNATGTKRKRKGNATGTRPERNGNEAGVHIFLMYMARKDPRRNRRERKTEWRTEMSEKNEEGRGTRKKDWHGSIEEGEREGRRKTKKIVARRQVKKTRGEENKEEKLARYKWRRNKRKGQKENKDWQSLSD